jgi:transcriptional regulator with XRE-family HTH domain
MRFCDKLKTLRTQQNLSQKTLAGLLGVTVRTVQNYEAGARFPQTAQITNKICEVFGVSAQELFSEEDAFLMQAAAQGGRAKTQAQALIEQASGLFAGGQLDEEDVDAVFRAITEAYWISKEKNKKYAPNKYKNAAK